MNINDRNKDENKDIDENINKDTFWITETYQNTYRMSYRYSEKLFSERSPFQKVEIYKTDLLGKVLLNDDLVMCSEKDEFVYHEMIAHVPLSVHPEPRKVLIIGGGDGGTAREVLKHSCVESVVMVEIDSVVVEACEKHLPTMAEAISSKRLNLKIEDGVKFVEQTDEKFDIVLIDSTDPIGPAAPLFGSEFYKNVHRCMTENAIVVSQCESPFFFLETQQSVMKILSQIFPKTRLYNYSNLTYPGGLWSFAFSSKGLDPTQDINFKATEDLNLNYYNAQIHKSCFSLPSFQKRALEHFFKG